MIADLACSPPSAADVSRRRRAALRWSMMILVVAAGVLGLYGDSEPGRLLAQWFNVQALFGLLLWALVLGRFYGRVNYGPPLPAADIGRLSRHLSRMVYLLLYSILGLRQLIALGIFIAHGGTFDFGLFHLTPDRGIFEPTEEFRVFLVYGLLALVIIRVLAAATGRLSGYAGPIGLR